MSEYKYKFSVVTAVYKVEPFLREAVDSIVNQTIGIENIQLILVDDGSPDNSGAICDEYAAKYPNNIFVIHKENGGVSSARNMGIDAVEGKYVNFMDSDDKWDLTAFKKVWDFFENNQDKTDVVSLPLKFFDGARGGHMVNYKFNDGTRVIDLTENWDAPQLHVNAAFFKAETFADKRYRFDTSLAFSEDCCLVQKILFKKQTLGVVANAVYHYRKRVTGVPSALQSSRTRANWYLPVIEKYFLELIELAKKELSEVPKFLQMTLMYDLQWRLKLPEFPEAANLSEDDKKKYLDYIKTVLQYIDDDVIRIQRYCWLDHKLYAYQLKYGKKPSLELQKVREGEEVRLVKVYSEETVLPIKSKALIEFVEIEDDVLKVTGTVNVQNLDYDNLDIFLLVNKEKVDIKAEYDNGVTTCLDEVVMLKKGFTAEIKLKKYKNYVIQVGININGYDVICDPLSFGKYAPVSEKYKKSYAKIGSRIVSRGNAAFFITKSHLIKRVGKEIKLLFEIAKNDGKLGIGAAGLRVLFNLFKAFKIKPVWLISDRAGIAGDNGEALFRYIRANHKNIDARFVLLEGSPDIERLKVIGPVVLKNSNQHKVLALISEYIISSHAEPEIFNPFKSRVEPFRSIWIKSKFVFLQHGITQNNISGWIRKNNKNFYGIITAAKPEYESFFEYDYRYKKENIWLTGFARFDRLKNKEEKVVTIMPTWRQYLMGEMDRETSIWPLAPGFENSDYFEFYNELINNKKLLEVAKKCGYKIKFFPHPNLQLYVDMFTQNQDVEFLTPKTAYKDVYSRSALLLTDYSSAAFDFSYLRKPIVYAHFDKETFYSGGHVCTAGYFDYERDGFGEVEYDLESTVNTIIEYMENGCQLKDKYRERIDNFFAFDDKNNCQRIYEKLTNKKQ